MWPGPELAVSQGVSDTMRQERPQLPAPNQVGTELWKMTDAMALEERAFSKSSLIYHDWVTLSATQLDFGIGAGVGILLRWGSSITARWQEA